MLKWQDLVWMSDEELARFDVTETHLACALDLPGAETIDYDRCVLKLKHLTDSVRRFTARKVQSRGREFGDTFNQSRIRMLATCLWQREGLHYNPAKIPE